MKNWHPDLGRSDSPLYMAIADMIELDLRSGRLSAGDKLPTHRDLAKRLAIDVTTVARGYVEAQKRGLVQAHVGRGTFVMGAAPSTPVAMDVQPDARRAAIVDPSMNMPPEPNDPDLIARMREGVSALSADLVPLLRYQTFGGAPMDKEAAALWLGRRGLTPSQERIFIAPGAHPALLAILGTLAKPGETVLSENITYPGMRSIAAQLRLRLVGLPMDDDGILPEAFAVACEREKPKALYLNPTLQNPLTLTMPAARRAEIAAVAQKYRVHVVEDDAYGFLPSNGPAPLAVLAPDLTWHIGGLSKCIGAGLRLAYVVAPEDGRALWSFASAMRSGNVMASPLTTALATRWIDDGTADAILDFLRGEAAARQALVAGLLLPGSYRADMLSFNIWLPLPHGWTRSTFGAHMRTANLGTVASDAFAVDGTPPEAVRVCLGGPISRPQLQTALEFMAHALEGPPEMAGTFF
ncbi:PLP-dependent aminotransferase family protein [Shinella sp. CPCC 101442]|uniref:aminotransferase-like domain-containing protein n=1 Tax=Shinella sp. CPCC 101442 TaxID=2932265 RepID=UPI0021532631|nr:PLP-dependent aminotransferase family protein [Shinella sp. CPCC 101442]MCR6498337.1 PLP-dependent aminotransferase family protein [Shinella sp. CPCC 101442]